MRDTGMDVEIFPRDARITVHRNRNIVPPISPRRPIVEFSDKSRNRLLFSAFNACIEWLAFITLTYPAEFSTDGKVVRKHRNKFLIYLSREHPGINYLWALEFQTRGAPHVHLLVDRFVSLHWLSETWYQIVGSDDEKHLRAGTGVEFVRGREHGASYLAKGYTGKKAQKHVPAEYQNVGRFWGTSRSLVKPLQSATLGLGPESLHLHRTLRRFVEKTRVKVRRLRPVSEHHSRKRYVNRKPSLRHLHTGLNGFTIHAGAEVASKLLEAAVEVGQDAKDDTE